jgi:hypothetical protein
LEATSRWRQKNDETAGQIAIGKAMPDIKQQIESANKSAVDAILAGRPTWVDVKPAVEVVPGMAKNMVLHAGPPIEFVKMCGPQRNGVIGAVMFEGLAGTREKAIELIENGKIAIEPCHNHDSVGAGTGITSASTPMVIIENRPRGNRAYSNIFESGALQGLKWGAFNDDIAKHLRWEADVLGPTLALGLKACGGLDVRSVIAKAVQMGDECHNRSVAATSVFFKELMPHMLRAQKDKDALIQCADFMAKSDHFFLHVIMAAAKAMLESASGISHSTIVTAMCRNGVDFGIQVAGMGKQWFIAPALAVEGLYFRSEWGPQDATLDLGDSCITETAGLGGMIQAAAPSVQQYVKGTLQDAIRNTVEMREICAGTNEEYRIPNLDFDSAPVGIDIRKVVQTRIAPLLDTAITHKEVGLIGAGQVRAPLACFDLAVEAFVQKYIGN